jgi:5-methyltetrahydropteroyltriglutamate--homocysteine methyltransferase
MAIQIRADQVGSLLRPQELMEQRKIFAEGKIDIEQLRQTEDAAILAALDLQKQAGIEVFTDGEYRRSDFQSDFAEAVEGFTTVSVPRQWHGPGGGLEPTEMHVVNAKLRQRCRLTAHEVEFMKKHSPGPIKITIPNAATMMLRAYRPGMTDTFYPTRSDLLAGLAEIIRNEIKALVEERVPYIQLDAPGYGRYVDQGYRQRMTEAGIDPDQDFKVGIAADNECIQGIERTGVTLAIHLCRGNNQSRWLSEGGYDPIAEKLFGSLEMDTFLLEYDSERAGGFEPLRFVPAGKNVVLGLVGTKSGELEPQDLLLRRIEEASKYVPLENLALSPQCGFATRASGNLLSWDDQRRKLELVASTARKMWG